MYADFALVYDRLMADVDYAAWAAHYRALLAQRGVQDGALVLEPACGTGSLTVHLAGMYQVLPSDLSEEMLSIAAEKARRHGLSLTFLRQDLQRLAAVKPADALVCACDGLNYLLTDAALKRFLRAARRALKPGGALAFDVSSVYKLRDVLAKAPQVFRSDDICYLWENAWQESAHRLNLSLTVFTRGQDSSWRRIDEEQRQRGWTEEALRDALAECGFADIRVYGEQTLARPARDAHRLHVTAITL